MNENASFERKFSDFQLSLLAVVGLLIEVIQTCCRFLEIVGPGN